MNGLVSENVNLQRDFDRIYVTYYGRMFRFAKEYVFSDEEAENIVQDIFLLLWEKREVLNIQVSLVSYLFSLVKNRCLDYLRHQTVTEEFQQELTLKLSSLEQLNDSFVTSEDLESILSRAIDKLPERCRDIFVKSRFEGKKYKEIAQEMHLSVSTVENQISIALKKLRAELKEFLPLLIFLFS